MNRLFLAEYEGPANQKHFSFYAASFETGMYLRIEGFDVENNEHGFLFSNDGKKLKVQFCFDRSKTDFTEVQGFDGEGDTNALGQVAENIKRIYQLYGFRVL